MAGLAPFTRQSGKWRGPAASLAAPRPRCAPPCSWPPSSPPITTPSSKPFYGTLLLATGKPKLVALIAVARKLIIILNAIIRDQKPWPNPLDNQRSR